MDLLMNEKESAGFIDAGCEEGKAEIICVEPFLSQGMNVIFLPKVSAYHCACVIYINDLIPSI